MIINPIRYTITTDEFVYVAIYIDLKDKWIVHRREKGQYVKQIDIYCLTDSGWERIFTPLFESKPNSLILFDNFDDIIDHIKSESEQLVH